MVRRTRRWRIFSARTIFLATGVPDDATVKKLGLDVRKVFRTGDEEARVSVGVWLSGLG